MVEMRLLISVVSFTAYFLVLLFEIHLDVKQIGRVSTFNGGVRDFIRVWITFVRHCRKTQV